MLSTQSKKNKKPITADFANNFYRTYFFYSAYYNNYNNKINFKPPQITPQYNNILQNKNFSQHLNNSLNLARNILEGLNYRAEDIKQTNIIIAKHKIEWHRKFTLSIACIIFMFIGASLGSIIRKGGFGFPVVVSVLFFIIYHVISITGEKFVKSAVLNAYLGMWAATIIIFPLAIYLTYKSINDSTILDQSKYYITIKKIIDYTNKIIRFQNPLKQNS
jgi:lipopolysaccharide export system permease protein